MNAQEIANEITENVKRTSIKDKPNLSLSKKYEHWTIGITNDLERRKKEHIRDGENVKFWKSWKANTENIARIVETHFIKLGMDGASGGGVNPDKVYIF